MWRVRLELCATTHTRDWFSRLRSRTPKIQKQITVETRPLLLLSEFEERLKASRQLRKDVKRTGASQPTNMQEDCAKEFQLAIEKRCELRPSLKVSQGALVKPYRVTRRTRVSGFNRSPGCQIWTQERIVIIAEARTRGGRSLPSTGHPQEEIYRDLLSRRFTSRGNAKLDCSMPRLLIDRGLSRCRSSIKMTNSKHQEKGNGCADKTRSVFYTKMVNENTANFAKLGRPL